MEQKKLFNNYSSSGWIPDIKDDASADKKGGFFDLDPIKYCGHYVFINSSYLRMNHYFTLCNKNRICDHKIYDAVDDNKILTE